MERNNSYFEQRIFKEMQLDKDYLQLHLKRTEPLNEIEISEKTPFIRESSDGNIEIYPFSLERKLIEFYRDDKRKTTMSHDAIHHYKITRLHPDKVNNGKNKYRIPKGQGTYPLIPPKLLELYEKKEHFDTLFLTEGYLKAVAVDYHLNLPIVGLSSITHYKDSKDKNNFHADVLKIIETCKVEQVVMIYDGDYNNLHKSALSEGEETAKRPYQFFTSALEMRNLITKLDKDFHFCHIRTDLIDGKPKGIDDLIFSHFDKKTEIARSLKKLKTDRKYFYKLNISDRLTRLKSYFGLDTVASFYNKYAYQIRQKKFIFFGTEYQYNPENDKIETIMPEAANKYIRVGDNYYELALKPNPEGTKEPTILPRLKSTISDDYGRKIFKYIPKFIDFINVPDHQDYQRVIEGYYNAYQPFTHEPKQGSWTATEMYLKHIFGEQYEIGLDYVQLLFERPTQIMPILCLVSEARGTGKTFFAVWLEEIFKGNTTLIGNAEIGNDFNAHLANKLVIAIDESFIEKKLILEKIKSLATRSKLPMQKKGKDIIDINFFGKIILLSNNVDNFVSAEQEEVRYWVRELKKPEKENPDLKCEMIKEIPAFLHFLERRKLSTKRVTRAWFAYNDLHTPALQRVIDRSKPQVARTIIHELTEMFLTYNLEELKFTLSDIHTLFFDGDKRINRSYIKETIIKHIPCIEPKNQRYKIPFLNGEDIEFEHKNGRAYTFFAEDFNVEIQPESQPEPIQEDLPF